MIDAITQIEHAIAKLKNKKKLIIGIDGYTGVGKTTILQKLVKHKPQIIGVNRDDFNKPRKVYESLLKKAEDKSTVFEKQILDTKKMRKNRTVKQNPLDFPLNLHFLI
jgi:uridine kinase